MLNQLLALKPFVNRFVKHTQINNLSSLKLEYDNILLAQEPIVSYFEIKM